MACYKDARNLYVTTRTIYRWRRRRWPGCGCRECGRGHGRGHRECGGVYMNMGGLGVDGEGSDVGGRRRGGPRAPTLLATSASVRAPNPTPVSPPLSARSRSGMASASSASLGPPRLPVYLSAYLSVYLPAFLSS